MKKSNRFLHLLPVMLVWAMLTAFFWSWIFNMITDTTPGKKITVFADVPEVRDVALAAELEKSLPGGLSMVKVHPFSYAMLNGNALRAADLYIIPASDAVTYREWFAPLPEAWSAKAELFDETGIPLGVPVLPSGDTTYLTFDDPTRPGEAYYLVFGVSSLHNKANPGAVDDGALPVAEALLKLISSEGGTQP